MGVGVSSGKRGAVIVPRSQDSLEPAVIREVTVRQEINIGNVWKCRRKRPGGSFRSGIGTARSIAAGDAGIGRASRRCRVSPTGAEATLH